MTLGETNVREMVMAAAALGLLATSACGKADKGAATTTAGAVASADAAVAFNAGLCQPGLDAHKGANAVMPVGGCLISPAKTYALTMMNSGDLKLAPVGADGKLGAAIWSTGTHASTPGSASTSFQEDGNLVIYDQPGNRPIWSSTSAGSLEPYHLALTDGGEVVATRVADGAAIWSSKTGPNTKAIKPAAPAAG